MKKRKRKCQIDLSSFILIELAENVLNALLIFSSFILKPRIWKTFEFLFFFNFLIFRRNCDLSSQIAILKLISRRHWNK